jgi:hypothetical protein
MDVKYLYLIYNPSTATTRFKYSEKNEIVQTTTNIY